MKPFLLSALVFSILSCSVVGKQTATPDREDHSEIDSFIEQSLAETSNSLQLVDSVSAAFETEESDNGYTSVFGLLSRILKDSGVGEVTLDGERYEYLINGVVERGVVAQINFSGTQIDGEINLQNIGIRVGESRYFNFYEQAQLDDAQAMTLNLSEVAEFAKALEEHVESVSHPTILGSLLVYLKEGRTYLQSQSLEILQGPYLITMDTFDIRTNEDSSYFESVQIKGSAVDVNDAEQRKTDVEIVLNDAHRLPRISVDHSEFTVDQIGVDSE